MPARFQSSAKDQSHATIGRTLGAAMVAIGRDDPLLKGVQPRDYARPGLEKYRLPGRLHA